MERKNYPSLLKSSDIRGDRVRNAAGEDLGKVEELMIDVNTGRIAYAVLSFGGFLNVGNKLFANRGRHYSSIHKTSSSF